MAVSSPAVLPEDFLKAKSPNIIANRINFAKTSLPEYTNRYAVVLDGVLSPAECQRLVAEAENLGSGSWERALVNRGNGEQTLVTEFRKCGRIIWDSRDLAARIWSRVEDVPEVQEIVELVNRPLINGKGPAKRGEVWRFTRLNERMRFLKYVGGEYFRPHFDGCYETPDQQERSNFTLHLYLNDSPELKSEELKRLGPRGRLEALQAELVGGATTFHSFDEDRQLDVLPKPGRVLIFQQRDLLHSGDDVVRGVKYTMRTDMMYSRHNAKPKAHAARPVLEAESSWDVELTNDEESAYK